MLMVPMTSSRVVIGTESSDARPVFRANSGYLYCFSSSTLAMKIGWPSRITRPISESTIFIYQHDAAHRRIQLVRHHLRDGLQNADQVVLLVDAFGKSGQRFHALR